MFQEMELSSFNIQKFLIFTQKKLFRYFIEPKPPKNSEKTLKTRLIFQEETFRATLKKCLIFREMELSSHRIFFLVFKSF